VHSETAHLKVDGNETANSQVSVDVLVRLLNGLQQMALVFAAAKEGQPVQQRFRPTSDLRSRYTLKCGVPDAGSYVMPVFLVDSGTQPPLPRSPSVLADMQSFIRATTSENLNQTSRLLPDSRYRERALRELRNLSPKGGERWTATFALAAGAAALIDAKMARHAERLLSGGADEQTVMTVTGELVAIDFDQRKLRVRHPATNREIECSYLPEAEDDLLESRRGLIQVTGTFTLDATGEPAKLSDVTRIEPVDLSPLVFNRIDLAGRTLNAVTELRLFPKRDESRQLYVVEDPGIDLVAHAFTRDDLADEIAAHVFLIWREYGLARPRDLTPKAQELRKAVLARFRESA
jgi:hypothetical protein